MPLSKIQAESMNLADNYAFTGTVSGAGGLVKLLTQSNVSAQGTYDIDSTYINSTYDDYFFTMVSVVSSTADLYARFFVSDTISTGAKYFNHGSRLDQSTFDSAIDGDNQIEITNGTATTAGGYVTRGFLLNVNSTILPTVLQTVTARVYSTTNIRGDDVQGGHDGGSMTDVVNGIRFFMSAGNIEVKAFNLFGVVK